MKPVKNFLISVVILFVFLTVNLLLAADIHKVKMIFIKENSLWISDENGNNQKKLTDAGKEGEKYYGPKWSPDGTEIIYTVVFGKSPEPKRELWVKDMIKGTNYKLTNGSGPVYWMTDDEIIFSKIGQKEEAKICKKNLSTGKEEFIARGIWYYDGGDGGVEYVSLKDKLIFQFIQGGRVSAVSVVDFTGKVLLNFPSDFKLHTFSRFEDYNEVNRELLVSIFNLGEPASNKLVSVNLNTMKLTYVYLNRNKQNCQSGKWSHDKKSLIVLDPEGNIEVLSDFKTIETNEGLYRYPLKTYNLTRKGNISGIKVVNNRIYYLQGYDLWSIGIDGSSPVKTSVNSGFDFFPKL